MTNGTENTRPLNLPAALPEQGVLVLQLYSTRAVEPDKARGEFLRNMIKVYFAHGTSLADEDYRDRPGQSLTERDPWVQKIKANGLNRAVLVRLVVQAPPDNMRQRHHEVERQLVQLLTKDGIVVSLISATSPRTALAQLHRPPKDGSPLMVQEQIDLAPFLAKSEH
jgi:hypothetical protein